MTLSVVEKSRRDQAAVLEALVNAINNHGETTLVATARRARLGYDDTRRAMYCLMHRGMIENIPTGQEWNHHKWFPTAQGWAECGESPPIWMEAAP